MTKGIRAFALTQFDKFLPQLEKLGGTEFRRKVMNSIMEKFDTTLASAATNYNYAFKLKRESDPDSVIGLGRDPITASSGSGRRPRKTTSGRGRASQGVTVIRESTGVVVAEDIPRSKAESMVAASGGRGKPRLVIQEDQE